MVPTLDDDNNDDDDVVGCWQTYVSIHIFTCDVADGKDVVVNYT